MSAKLSSPDNHSIIVAGHSATGQLDLKNFFNTAFQAKVEAILAQEVPKDASHPHSILVVGRQASESIQEMAKKVNATLVHSDWADEVFKTKKWITPTAQQILWSANEGSSGKDEEGDTEMGDGNDKQNGGNSNQDKENEDNSNKDKENGDNSSKGKENEDNSGKDKKNEDNSGKDKENGDNSGKDKKNGDNSNKDKENGDNSNKDKENEDNSNKDKENEDNSNKDKENEDNSNKDKEGDSGKSLKKEDNNSQGLGGIPKKEESVPPPPKGPNSFEMDPIRRGWYDRVSGGPWTMVVPVHPADQISRPKEPRMNYTMCIEGIYMNWFVVTDPKTPIFVEKPQLRDSFLVPCWAHSTLKERYIKAGGNQFYRRTLDSLLGCDMEDFNFWSISYDGRICMVIGQLPGDSVPGMWSRSDLRKVWGINPTDQLLNMIRAEMSHPWMLKGGRRKGVDENSINQLQSKLKNRGASVEIDLTRRVRDLSI